MKLGKTILSVLGTAVVVVIWWVTSRVSGSLYYPPLPDVLTSVWEYWFTGEGASHLASSLTNLAVGLSIGIVAASDSAC